MARFTSLPPAQVHLGRRALLEAALQPYEAALAEMVAGRIELERGETPRRVKQLLHEAAQRRGQSARSSIVDEGKAIVFKTYPHVRRVSRLDD